MNRPGGAVANGERLQLHAATVHKKNHPWAPVGWVSERGVIKRVVGPEERLRNRVAVGPFWRKESLKVTIDSSGTADVNACRIFCEKESAEGAEVITIRAGQ